MIISEADQARLDTLQLRRQRWLTSKSTCHQTRRGNLSCSFVHKARAILDKIEQKKQGKKGCDKNEDGSDDERDSEVDQGPALCSVDQSAITGESLAVDKYIVSFKLPHS